MIIAGKAGSEDTCALLDAAHAGFVPDKVVMVLDPEDPEDTAFWRQHNPQGLDMVTRHFDALGVGVGAGAGWGGGGSWGWIGWV